ncbi:hypothetical protein CEUSTIGMA_g5008.t1 [Chlamydomonas eustigma]|uniref:Spermatogenesis-associated protein 20-like TRX domain-containing protein n=1 Tax=Chlamydomonas eustigma TaxID=1157962 RepID=A0A250X3A9_9CHLO|nr:hypothetical protein CEUSTIGMA_g5008.t1 [Chlamydomonas eustigma]|eukprot:GAX77564.1 hypothetical protein CEUSTIGMA_g5008.t1 [Chlamydomonas eustigma]
MRTLPILRRSEFDISSSRHFEVKKRLIKFYQNFINRAKSSVMASSASPSPDPTHPKHTNQLIKEQSPYLLQHAHNPVDWHPWGEEAFQLAKTEKRPIFLSVGYATCHWCHVMEHESFENEETADLMNKSFINIKVDREERPDVDRVYMAFVQATTGRGGWPMSVWLTPDLEPIYGGTYYPTKDMFQGGQLAMPAFQTVLRRIATMWVTNQEDLMKKGSDIMARLQEATSESLDSPEEASLEPGEAVAALLSCEEGLRKRFDNRLGGFGSAPKFPRPSEIEVLFHTHIWHKAQGNVAEAKQALEMATFSLSKMAAGGMYDHIGGGFHRYSVDEFWHVPHFEKMLYDGPQLVSVYVAAYQLTGNVEHAFIARGVMDYLMRDMTHPCGGLFSAEDADSLDLADGVKKEGSFYLWTKQEIEDALGGREAAELFCLAYSIKEEGNCTLSDMSDPHEEFGGKNVPIVLKPLRELAKEVGMPLAELRKTLAAQRQLLHTVRCSRPRPSLDDKVVTAWNGMAISAFAVASRALMPSTVSAGSDGHDDPSASDASPEQALFPVQGGLARQYMEAALSAARFIKKELYDETHGTLLRSYRNSPSAIPGYADDYANMICGLLDLYECGGGLEWLLMALRLQSTMDALFWDKHKGGYFSTSGADPSIKMRMKDDYDGAEPTASSVAARNLYRLSALMPASPSNEGVQLPYLADQGACTSGCSSTAPGTATTLRQGEGVQYAEQAEATLNVFSERLMDSALSLPKMCCAVHLKLKQPLRQVVVAGSLSSSQTQALLDAVHSVWVPDKTVLVLDLSDHTCVDFFQLHNPMAVSMVKDHTSKHGTVPTVFICQDFSCQAPTTDPQRVIKLLGESKTTAPKTEPITLPFTL